MNLRILRLLYLNVIHIELLMVLIHKKLYNGLHDTVEIKYAESSLMKFAE